MSRQFPTGKRTRESREAALLLLFEWSFGYSELDEIIEAAKEAGRPEAGSYALKLARKATENREELDRLVEQYSQGWKLNRLSRMLLTTLRMALCEMTLMTGVPAGVSINEAVELLKKYGGKDDAAYLNGVLGTFEQVRQGKKPEPPRPARPEPEGAEAEAPETEQPVEAEEQAPANDETVELVEGFDVEID